MTSSDVSSPRVQTNEFLSSQHSSPFERPVNPDLVLDTENKSIHEIGDTLISVLKNKLK